MQNEETKKLAKLISVFEAKQNYDEAELIRYKQELFKIERRKEALISQVMAYMAPSERALIKGPISVEPSDIQRYGTLLKWGEAKTHELSQLAQKIDRERRQLEKDLKMSHHNIDNLKKTYKSAVEQCKSSQYNQQMDENIQNWLTRSHD